MRNVPISVSVAFICIAASAASKETVKRAYIDSEGRVHIVSADGGDRTILPKKWQAGGGFEAVDIAPDGEPAGWLADLMLTPLEDGTNDSCAAPLEIDMWRAGHMMRRFMSSGVVPDTVEASMPLSCLAYLLVLAISGPRKSSRVQPGKRSCGLRSAAVAASGIR